MKKVLITIVLTAAGLSSSAQSDTIVVSQPDSVITTAADEKAAIRNAKMKDIDLLRGVLSRYVLEGRYKSKRWIEAAERGVFYLWISGKNLSHGNRYNL